MKTWRIVFGSGKDLFLKARIVDQAEKTRLSFGRLRSRWLSAGVGLDFGNVFAGNGL